LMGSGQIVPADNGLTTVSDGDVRVDASKRRRHCVGGDVQRTMEGRVQVRKWSAMVVGGWKKRGRRRTEKQKIKGSLAHNTMVDGVVKLGKDLMSVGRDL
jgi:hypothetical protein